jgi:hypothetical protein
MKKLLCVRFFSVKRTIPAAANLKNIWDFLIKHDIFTNKDDIMNTRRNIVGLAM